MTEAQQWFQPEEDQPEVVFRFRDMAPLGDVVFEAMLEEQLIRLDTVMRLLSDD